MSDLERLRERLFGHALYGRVGSVDGLRAFMGLHVYAVWDFMALLKRLQRDFTCTTSPWLPPVDSVAARTINEIVVAEESDLDPQGQPASHLELYLAAMDEAGADRRPFEAFLAALRAGQDLELAFEAGETPAAARAFVRHTLAQASQGDSVEVLAAFLHGREDPIPAMFTRLLAGLGEGSYPALAYYLERHVDLDGEEHSVAAAALLERLCVTPADRARAEAAAASAIEARLALWDGAEAAASAAAAVCPRT